jgi:taurine dioxygenase
MQATQLKPFGMEVTGVDLGALDASHADAVARLIATARVAVFREQTIDDAGLVRFLRRLGPLTFTDGETPVADAPDLNVVSNVGRTTPPRSVFHTDTSYVRQPPAFTALRPVLLPARGGATLFSDQVSAANRLPAKARQWLRGRSVVHGGGTQGGASVATRHPLFRRHPLTREVALFLSTPERCTQLSDVDERSSARIIRALYARSARPSALYRHEWRDGDVLVWDNRVTMHRADHDGVAGDRILHRGMVRGEVPIGE